MLRRLSKPSPVMVVAVTSTLCLVAGGLFAAGVIRTKAEADSGSQCGNTAAETLSWGTPNRTSDFTDPSSLDAWTLYDSVGHGGNGRRTPEAISATDGVLTITGDARGNSGGMGSFPGQLYGRWEACIKSPPSAPGYHAVFLLWPDAEDWPVGGEVDIMEAKRPDRQSVESWLHYGRDDDRVRNEMPIDATQWHSWAVEWTPKHVAVYVDGVMWWEETDHAKLPPRSMHACLQLDNMGGDVSQGAQMMVDWLKQYPA